MGKLRLHLDADASSIALLRALIDRGHDVTQTPNAWMPLDASDEQQLLGATAQGRCIFTFNIKHFDLLSRMYPYHGGVILSTQKSLSDLVRALDCLLSETDSDEWVGQVRWLNDWMR